MRCWCASAEASGGWMRPTSQGEFRAARVEAELVDESAQVRPGRQIRRGEEDSTGYKSHGSQISVHGL